MYKILIADNESGNIEIPDFEPETPQEQNQELPVLPEINRQSQQNPVMQDINNSGIFYISCAALIILLLIAIMIFRIMKLKGRRNPVKAGNINQNKDVKSKFTQSTNNPVNLTTPKDIHKCILQFLENTKFKR